MQILPGFRSKVRIKPALGSICKTAMLGAERCYFSGVTYNFEEPRSCYGFPTTFPSLGKISINTIKGKTHAWREKLSDEQAEEIVADYSEVMKRFGYLMDDGEIVF